MEEKKNGTVAKEVSMKPQKSKIPEKMSYEQLENIANQLSQQNKQMYTELQKMNMTNVFKRLDYLFKIVEFGHMFDADFLKSCIKEIKEIMTVPEETTEVKDSKTN